MYSLNTSHTYRANLLDLSQSSSVGEAQKSVEITNGQGPNSLKWPVRLSGEWRREFLEDRRIHTWLLRFKKKNKDSAAIRKVVRPYPYPAAAEALTLTQSYMCPLTPLSDNYRWKGDGLITEVVYMCTYLIHTADPPHTHIIVFSNSKKSEWLPLLFNTIAHIKRIRVIVGT